jgi:hypothetical protein
LLGGIGFAVLRAASVASIASLVVRFQRSRELERQQLKWVTFAAGLLIVVWIANVAVAPSIDDDWAWASLVAALLVLAANVGLAILRHRLFDIDVVINRTLVYGALTATLAGAYVGSVLLLQLVLSPGSDLAIAGSTLAVAALFRPARGRIQAAVDRRFYRRKYDAQRTLESFAGRMRDEVALDALAVELRAAVAETMQPAHVSLWVRGR